LAVLSWQLATFNCKPGTAHCKLTWKQKKQQNLPATATPYLALELSQKPGILFTGGNDKGLVEWSLETTLSLK
jgi:hypothetical protein